MLAMRRFLILILLLATGVAQAMATACPMGLARAGGGDEVAHSHWTANHAHAGHGAVSASGADSSHDGVQQSGRSPSGSPLHPGTGCAVAMSCAPSLPTPATAVGMPAWDLGTSTVNVASKHLNSAYLHHDTPPPRFAGLIA